MSLRVESLFGVQDKVAVALDRLRAFEPQDGFYVAFSGGKDSQVILELARQAGVKFDAHMALTTVDPPEVLRFVRQHYPDVELIRPEMSMFRLIVHKGMPPTRRIRYCCEYLKERGGNGRFVVTGIRWAESARRGRRVMVESCNRSGHGRRLLHPIIDWSVEDVWEYLAERGVPHCSLYDEGWTRIGCVMCPCASREKVALDAARWPHIAEMYRHAIDLGFDRAKAAGLRDDTSLWHSGDDVYQWWLSQSAAPSGDPPLESLFEEGE